MMFRMLKKEMENVLERVYRQGKMDCEAQWYSPHDFKPPKGQAVVIELRELTRDYKTVGFWDGGEEWVVGFQDDRVTSQEIWRWCKLP